MSVLFSLLQIRWAGRLGVVTCGAGATAGAVRDPSGSALFLLRSVGPHGGVGLQSAAREAEPGAGPSPLTWLLNDSALLPCLMRCLRKPALGLELGGNTRCLYLDQGQTWGSSSRLEPDSLRQSVAAGASLASHLSSAWLCHQAA